MTSHPLPARIKTIWLLSALGSFLFGSAITALLLLPVHFWHWPLWLVFVAGLLTIVEVLIELALVPYRYRFWRYLISETTVELQSGFIIRRQVAIPISRVQNVTLSAGPLLQWQHLQKVTVETASTTHGIDGLEPAVAQQLRDQIMALALEAVNHDH